MKLSDIVGTLWRGKWLIFLITTIAICAMFYYIFFVATPLYTAKSVLAFESREEQVVDLESVVSGLGGDQSTINTEVEVLRSRNLFEKLVRELDLTADPEFNTRLQPEPAFSIGMVLELILGPQPDETPSEDVIVNAVIDVALSKVSISNIRQSFVFEVTATTENAEKSAQIANTLARLYVLDQLEVKFEATQQATQWLTQRVASLQIDLEQAVSAVKDFNSTSNLISAETLDALDRQIKELRETRAEALESVDATAARVVDLNVAAATGNRTTMATVANDRTLTRILELAEDGTDITESFSVRFQQIRDRAALDSTRAQNQADALALSISELEEQVAQQSADLVQLQQLQREAEASRLIYETFLGRLKETSVQEGLQQADSRILSNAVVPQDESAPNKPILMILAAIVGGLIGSGIVLLRELSQNTFRTPEDLEAVTGHTVLGQIPKIPARRRSNVLQYLREKPTSAAAEAVRNMRTSTLLSNIDKPPQVIMSTSSIPGEGKTTQSLSLAHNLSGLGKRVLLIEGDIRRRVFAQYFDVKGYSGIVSVLSGDKTLSEAVVTSHPDLAADILLGERTQTNAADLFSSQAFRDLMVEARAQYDYIVIDTPPVLIVPDARVIGQFVDAILYTVRWDMTTKRQVLLGLKSFENVNLSVTGLVLGQISLSGLKKYGYGDSYGAYGQGYYDN